MTDRSQRQAPRLLPILLQAFVLAVCLAFVATEAWRLADSHRQAEAGAEQDMSNLAKSVSRQAADSLLLADGVLTGVVDRLETFGVQPVGELNAFLAEEVERSSRIRGLFVYGADGRWLASSLRTMPAGQNNQDRLYFRHHQRFDDGRSYLGPPIQSRSDGRWIITLSRRYEDADGRFAGVVLASIEAQYFADFYADFDLGHQGVIALVGQDGVIYARSPDNEGNVGRSLAATDLFRRIRGHHDGLLAYRSPVDQIERLSSFRRVDGFPLMVIAAESRNEVLAAWRKAAWVHGTLTLVSVLLCVVLGTWLARQLRLRELAESRMAQLARTDSLTGLANRRAFEEVLENEWARAARQGTSIGLLMIDVDDFKSFNDTYGHQAGDLCLKRVAEAVRQCARRPADTPARYGGEEMALILPGIDLQGLGEMAESVRLAVLALAVPHMESRTGRFLSVSIGASLTHPRSREDAEARDQLIRAADDALYDAKAAGRNRVALAR
ncbi:GGDEF domain-containing protein [Pseudoxanthomonas composti]|uniref:diguanylate cyclase n=1 Tax=Pseudoxanthomonas composti TaxID=2137479 RepID=A0A4V1N109_9GAMM|nr:diguanylate cyclase [Pseudoxanthomonas composti]RXR05225.1 diguanylate cyclase [Pseudoxanthomonas composti]